MVVVSWAQGFGLARQTKPVAGPSFWRVCFFFHHSFSWPWDDCGNLLIVVAIFISRWQMRALRKAHNPSSIFMVNYWSSGKQHLQNGRPTDAIESVSNSKVDLNMMPMITKGVDECSCYRKLYCYSLSFILDLPRVLLILLLALQSIGTGWLSRWIEHKTLHQPQEKIVSAGAP